MKNVRAMLAAMTLGLILSGAAIAGEVNTPGYVPPPPPPTATAPGDISTPGFATELLIVMLNAFYQ